MEKLQQLNDKIKNDGSITKLHEWQQKRANYIKQITDIMTTNYHKSLNLQENEEVTLDKAIPALINLFAAYWFDMNCNTKLEVEKMLAKYLKR